MLCIFKATFVSTTEQYLRSFQISLKIQSNTSLFVREVYDSQWLAFSKLLCSMHMSILILLALVANRNAAFIGSLKSRSYS